MKQTHKQIVHKILHEEMTLEELTGNFISLLQQTILPFIKKLEDMYYSRVDLTLEEQTHLQELKNIVIRYLHFEERILLRIHSNKLITYLDEELSDVKKITHDVRSLDIDGLEHDFEDLLVILESINARLQHILALQKTAGKK